MFLKNQKHIFVQIITLYNWSNVHVQILTTYLGLLTCLISRQYLNQFFMSSNYHFILCALAVVHHTPPKHRKLINFSRIWKNCQAKEILQIKKANWCRLSIIHFSPPPPLVSKTKRTVYQIRSPRLSRIAQTQFMRQRGKCEKWIIQYYTPPAWFKN